MNLEVRRTKFGEKATLGELWINGVFECYTLEDKVREIPGVPVAQWKIPHVTAIPAKIYRVIIDFSNRFKRLMPHILDVPGFDGVRMHSGNTDANTEGCILLGRHILNDDFISESRLAFDAFFTKLSAAITAGETVTLQISEHRS